MRLPIMTFWFMSDCIRRLRADSDMRALNLHTAAQSGESAVEYQEKLVLELGTIASAPVVPDVERDEEGFAELKAMAAAM